MKILQKRLQGDFTIIDNRIARCSSLSLEAKGLYYYMISLPNDWDFSEARISQSCGLGIDKLKRVLKELFSIGLLKRDFYYNELGHRKSIYTLFDFDTINAEPTSVLPTKDFAENQKPTSDFPTKEKPMNNKEYNINNINKESNIESNNKKESIKNNNKSLAFFCEKSQKNNECVLPKITNIDLESSTSQTCSSEIDENFESLWRIYPNKQGKQEAKKSYIKAIKGSKIKGIKNPPAKHEDILEGVRKYITYKSGSEIKYMKHLSTFINQRCYEDFISNDIQANAKVGECDDHPDYLNADKQMYINLATQRNKNKQ